MIFLNQFVQNFIVVTCKRNMERISLLFFMEVLICVTQSIFTIYPVSSRQQYLDDSLIFILPVETKEMNVQINTGRM